MHDTNVVLCSAVTWEGAAAAALYGLLCFFAACVFVICFPFMYTGQLQPAEPLLRRILCIMCIMCAGLLLL